MPPVSATGVALKELLQKLLIVLGASAACGLIGLVVPMLFDRDVGGALAAMICGCLGVIIGVFAGLFAVRRIFD